MIAIAQIPHNSIKFAISNYYYPDTKGGFKKYISQGFVQPRAGTAKARLFMLPILSREENKVKYISDEGTEFTPYVGSKVAKSIIIPIKILSELPNSHQIPAIVSSLEEGITQPAYIRPPVTGPNNSFYIYPPATVMIATLQQSMAEYKTAYDKQQELAKRYTDYSPQLASLTEVEVSILVEDLVISNKKFTNTLLFSSGLLANMEVVSPTVYMQNRILGGNYDILVSYKFRDAKTSTIDAKFEASKIIKHFLEETQKSISQSSSSGWQVLGFGSRKKKLKTSLSMAMKENYKGENYQSTEVEMFDATDDMIDEFERDFFPEITKERAIENHQAAAAAAEASGNIALRDLHLRYATSLINNDPNLEVDIAKAAAALSSKDYVGFVAHGVRWGSNTASGNSSFRRVVNTSTEISTKTNWSQMRTVSVQHSVSTNVPSSTEQRQVASLGICGAIQYTYPIYQQNMYGGYYQSGNRVGIMPSCIATGSPAHNSGLMPGMIIKSIGGQQITTGADLDALLASYSPGDDIAVRIVEYNGYVMSERSINLKLAAGAPLSTN